MSQAQKTSFTELIQNSDVPVLVDFWAPWCGPCRMMEPAIKNIAHSHEGKLKVLKINVDNNPQISQHYQISSIPTLMLFDKGQVVARQSGAMAEPQLKQWLQSKL